MANEITAEELARKVYSPDYDGDIPSFWTDAAETFLTLTRALAALQAERAKDAPLTWAPLAPSTGIEYLDSTVTSDAKDAPERVRCWITEIGYMTTDPNIAAAWHDMGRTVTEGYFTAKGSNDD